MEKNGHQAMAEDIFQDGMSIMYNNLLEGKFREESKLSTYLISICKNLWLMELRKTKIVKYDSMIPDLTDEQEVLIKDELLIQLQSEMNTDCQKILRAYYYDGLSMEEIRKSFDLGSQQAAKNKKYRCLQKLVSIIKSKGLTLESFKN